jgi:hypothetical protein
MKKRQDQQLPTVRSWRRWAMLGGVLVVGMAAVWWVAGGPNAWGEKPRLVVDRDAVDLGDLPFDTPAHVVFTLTNSGEGTLTLAGAPRVEAVKGC